MNKRTLLLMALACICGFVLYIAVLRKPLPPPPPPPDSAFYIGRPAPTLTELVAGGVGVFSALLFFMAVGAYLRLMLPSLPVVGGLFFFGSLSLAWLIPITLVFPHNHGHLVAFPNVSWRATHFIEMGIGVAIGLGLILLKRSMWPSRARRRIY